MKTYTMEHGDVICREAHYLLNKRATVREASAHFGRSKSTIHKDMRKHLPQINPTLAMEVAKVLDTNRAERHIRGGMATRAKYRRELS